MYTWGFHVKLFNVAHVSAQGLLQITEDHTPAVEVAPTQHNSREESYQPPTHGDDKAYYCRRKDKDSVNMKKICAMLIFCTYCIEQQLKSKLQNVA